MEHSPFNNDLRKSGRAQKLGANPSCLLCGVSTPEALTQVQRSVLEEHHVAGVANDPEFTVLLCLNCHASATEGQRDVGADLSHSERHPLERIEAFLRSVADFLIRLAGTAWQLANWVAWFIRQLDLRLPDWRAIPIEAS